MIDLEETVGKAIVKEAWAIEGLPVKALTTGYKLLGRAAITEYLAQQKALTDERKQAAFSLVNNKIRELNYMIDHMIYPEEDICIFIQELKVFETIRQCLQQGEKK